MFRTIGDGIAALSTRLVSPRVVRAYTPVNDRSSGTGPAAALRSAMSAATTNPPTLPALPSRTVVQESGFGLGKTD